MAPRHLCIVSRDPLLSGVFIEALTTALGPRDKLEIIVDRRRGGPTTDQPSVERRHRPHVVDALERDGFAIVRTPTTQATEHRNLNLPRVPGASPIERLALREADERKLERILGFKHRRQVRLGRWLILAGLMNAILILLVLSPVVKTLMSRARPAAPPSFETTPPQVALPQVDVVRNPTPTSEGGGDAYAVRLSDRAGRPLAGAEVSLLIRMADGTLLDVPLGSGPELGTYHVTIPALQPAPVDLRIRVVMSDTRVEIAVRP